MEEELKRKILGGKMTEEEWKALEKADQEQALTAVLVSAVQAAEAVDTAGERLAAGLLFQELPDDAAGLTLPGRYAVGPGGVYHTVVMKKNGNMKAEVIRLTRTPFFIVARDAGSGRVKLLVQLQCDWRGEWVQASWLTTRKLTNWFIFPEPGVREKELVAYARACAAVAPFKQADDAVAQAAVEILRQLFPAAAAGVEFPALRAFADVRAAAEELGVDPLEIRRWWSRQGIITEGASRVKARSKEELRNLPPETPRTARVLAFTGRVRDFLAGLPEERPREGKIFHIRHLTGPDTGREALIALPVAAVVPLGAEVASPGSPLAAALAGRRWPGEVREVVVPERGAFQIQILEIDPPLHKQEQDEQAQATRTS